MTNTILVIFGIYVVGYIVFLALMFFQSDHKFGNWWIKGKGPNWHKLMMCSMFAIVWIVLIFPERRWP